MEGDWRQDNSIGTYQWFKRKEGLLEEKVDGLETVRVLVLMVWFCMSICS